MSIKQIWDGEGIPQLRHPSLLFLLALGLLGLLYVIHRVFLLPRPIRGIPYNAKAASSIFGDIPEFLAAPSPWEWWAKQGPRHQSAIAQVFVRPFGRPWVIVSDPWEAVDISLRRTKEFDNSDMNYALFEGVIPGHQITLKSSNPLFKTNRELVKDLMSPSFLHEVTAPEIYAKILMLLDLWHGKIDLAKGRPFQVAEDISHSALDIILATSFGFDNDTSQVAKQIRHLKPLQTSLKNNMPGPLDDVEFEFEFEPVPLDHDLSAFTVLGESIGQIVGSPIPRIHHFLYRNLSSKMRRAAVSRDRVRNKEIAKSLERKSAGQPQKCALDHLLAREEALAAKEGRAPNYHSQAIETELLGYLIAGHDTTSAVLRWGMKYLTDTREAQNSLREALRAAHPKAREEGRLPALDEILKAQIPYVDAVIEEMMRLSWVAPLRSRQAIVDTQILGVPIPKGTMVVAPSNGPGYMMPPVPVDETKRSKTGQDYRRKVGSFGDHDLGAMLPERWLKKSKNEMGEETVVFDANAGPAMGFGNGPRGCFGRRMAIIQIKVFLTLVMWSFELLPLAPEMSGYEASFALARIPSYVFLKLQKIEF